MSLDRIPHLVWEYRWLFATGLWLTIQLTFAAIAISLVTGIIAALGTISRLRLARWCTVLIVEFCRNTPILVLVVWVHYALPELTGIKTSAIVSSIIALAMQSTGYLAEEHRAGIESIDKGQFEPAQSLGMTYARLRRRFVTHLEAIDSGSILVDRTHILPDRLEENEKKLSPRAVARFRTRIGMVFQSFNLFPHLTALGNIIEAPIGVLGWPRAKAVEHAMTLLRRVGLEDKARAYPATLSGGQQQRVAIVRALIMDPPIMLFDEPTSALDPQLTDEVLTVIRDLAIRNRTSIIVTHEMGFARNVATDIVVMADGKIAEQGPPE